MEALRHLSSMSLRAPRSLVIYALTNSISHHDRARTPAVAKTC